MFINQEKVIFKERNPAICQNTGSVNVDSNENNNNNKSRGERVGGEYSVFVIQACARGGENEQTVRPTSSRDSNPALQTDGMVRKKRITEKQGDVSRRKEGKIKKGAFCVI